VLRGHGVVGIAHASAAYFRKKPSQLDVGEAALLAGLLPAPEYLSPYKNVEAAKRARNQVRYGVSRPSLPARRRPLPRVVHRAGLSILLVSTHVRACRQSAVKLGIPTTHHPGNL